MRARALPDGDNEGKSDRFLGTHTTVVPTKSDSDVVFCLQLLSKTLTCTHHLS